MVWLGRIGPPSVKSHIVKIREILPVDVTSFRIEHIVWHYATIFRPCIKRHEGIDLLEFPILTSPWTKVRPNGNHQVGIVLVDIFHHLFWTLQSRLTLRLHAPHILRKIFVVGRIAHFINIVRILEFHRIPVGVASPVLPILNDGIRRNLQLTILVQYTSQLIAGLISLTALPEAHRPLRKHGSLTCQLSDAGDNTILRTILVHEVIVGASAYFAREGSEIGIIEVSLAGIVPIESIAFLAGKVRDGNIGIVVP